MDGWGPGWTAEGQDGRLRVRVDGRGSGWTAEGQGGRRQPNPSSLALGSRPSWPRQHGPDNIWPDHHGPDNMAQTTYGPTIMAQTTWPRQHMARPSWPRQHGPDNIWPDHHGPDNMARPNVQQTTPPRPSSTTLPPPPGGGGGGGLLTHVVQLDLSGSRGFMLTRVSVRRYVTGRHTYMYTPIHTDPPQTPLTHSALRRVCGGEYYLAVARRAELLLYDTFIILHTQPPPLTTASVATTSLSTPQDPSSLVTVLSPSVTHVPPRRARAAMLSMTNMFGPCMSPAPPPPRPPPCETSCWAGVPFTPPYGAWWRP